jgi:hypothetical protein
MNGFEYLLTLFGLLLGLALAEGLGGLATALHMRRRTPIGWPTALLGIFVSCDVVSFWMNGWALRDVLPVSWPVMFGGFVMTAIVFVSTSLVFPKDPEDWADIDGHFDRNRALVIGGLLACNAVFLIIFAMLVGIPRFHEPRVIVIIWSVFPVGLVAMFARRRALVLAALTYMVAMYPLSLIWR